MKLDQGQLSALDKLAIARTEDLDTPISDHPDFATTWNDYGKTFNALSEMMSQASVPVGLLNLVIDEVKKVERLTHPGIYKQGYLDALKDLQQSHERAGLSTTARPAQDSIFV